MMMLNDSHFKSGSLGRFQRGIIPWNKGKKGVYCEETLEAMRNAKLGKRMSPKTEFRKGQIAWNEETKEKMLKHLREKILIKPNLNMTQELAYTLGVLLGDGCVFKQGNSYRITLDVTEKQFALSFLESLKKIGLRPFLVEKTPSNRIGKLEKYIVIAYSKNFGIWYTSLIPYRILELIKEKEDIIEFIRGFYESKGSLYINKKYNKTITVSMYNTEKETIDLLLALNKKIDFNFYLNGPYKNSGSLSKNKPKDIYRLSLHCDNARNFLKTIRPKIKNGECN